MKAALSTLIFTVVAAIMAAAQHQPYYLISPTPGQPVEAGKGFRVEWLNGQEQDVTVYLLEGSSRENMLPTGYSVKGNGASGGVGFKIPADTDPKGRYALRINYVSDKGKNAQAFSSAFQVTGGTPIEKPASVAPSATKSTEATPSAVISSPDAKDEEKDVTKEPEKKDTVKETADASATPESQEEKNVKSSAVSVKFAAIILAVPAMTAGAFYA